MASPKATMALKTYLTAFGTLDHRLFFSMIYKNPKNIAPGGFWRYKEHGKAAIIDIFKMTMAEFNSLKKIKDDDKTVLDQMLFNKFESAMNGNSRDADFLLLQAFGYAPKYGEAKYDYQADFRQKKSPLDDLTVEELRALIKDT